VRNELVLVRHRWVNVGTWNRPDSDVDTSLARSLKQMPWTTNLNPELPRTSPSTIALSKFIVGSFL
jgi:hypothetical protein